MIIKYQLQTIDDNGEPIKLLLTGLEEAKPEAQNTPAKSVALINKVRKRNGLKKNLRLKETPNPDNAYDIEFTGSDYK